MLNYLFIQIYMCVHSRALTVVCQGIDRLQTINRKTLTLAGQNIAFDL